jgi:hypothetical protein
MEIFDSSPNLYEMTGKRNYIGRRFVMNENIIDEKSGGNKENERYISTTFYIYDGLENRNLEKVYHELKEIYIYLMNKYNCNTSIDTVFIILSPDRKYITFDERGGDVNSAYYVPSKRELAVYKDEEFHLRFIHEVMHHILGDDECNIPICSGECHSIFQDEEFSLLEICAEYHTMKNYLELYPEVDIQRILKKRRRYMEYLSSIKNKTILARFLRYFIFPTEMLVQELNLDMNNIDNNLDNLTTIDYDLIYRKLTDKLRESPKYNNGFMYVKFI